MFNDAALFALEILHRLVVQPEAKQFFSERRERGDSDQELYFELLDFAEACTTYFNENYGQAPCELDLGEEVATLILRNEHPHISALSDADVFERLVPYFDVPEADELDELEAARRGD